LTFYLLFFNKIFNGIKRETMGKKDDCLFIITPELYDPENGYEVGVIWPKIQGIFGSKMYFGFDWEDAIELANCLNTEFGHDIAFVTDVYNLAAGLSDVHFFNA